MTFALGRLFLLPNTILALCASHALADLIQPREAAPTTIPAPIYISPDQNWDGIDGAWSTFTLRVGTPQQFVRTLVSFASYQTWVVLPQGCQAATDWRACRDARGWLFNETKSSTFHRVGIYDIWLERHLGYHGNAIYGYDTVGLGGQGEEGPTLKNTTVGGLAVEDYYLGVFGINPRPTNFTSFNDPAPSYLSKLKEQGYIPSVSFGYTAGAKYRFTGVLASLVLGGYDTSKFLDNDVIFNSASDNDRDLVVAIQSVSTPSKTESNPVATELLPNAVYAYIDSTVPHIWLPIEACRVFEREFGLVYDNTTKLYLVNETLHDSLVKRNPNITFSLGQNLSGGPNVQITLPYAAFDLEAQPPYAGLSEKTRYFPLQQAQNDTQYTLGRTFMQEAYIAVDWESALFNVSQVRWVAEPEQHLVPILPQLERDGVASGSGGSTSSSPSSSSSDALTTGAKVGLAVGAAAGFAIFGIVALWVLRWRKRNFKIVDNEKIGPDTPQNVRRSSTRVYQKAELDGSAVPAENKRLISANGTSTAHTPEAVAGYFGLTVSTPSGNGTHSSTQSGHILSPLSATTSEADSRELRVHEMPGDMPAIREKFGKALSEKEAMAHREKVYNGVDSAQSPTTAVNEGIREPRRVDPEDVVDAEHLAGERDKTVHERFSFEFGSD